MGAMDHRRGTADADWCVNCLETWPCDVAKIRRELAEFIRSEPVGNTGDEAYDNGREAGRESAADSINYEGN